MNLVSNANKFSDICSNILIHFNTNKDDLIITVSDTGMGIKEENIDNIFQAFEQLNNNCSNGTGLGLAICKKLSKLLGGDITVESDFGKGSTFIVKIKYKKQEYFVIYVIYVYVTCHPWKSTSTMQKFEDSTVQ